MTDFGIPKVIGGNFNVLATDVFKLVIGQQDFAKGAVVAILLLAPAVLTFAVDKYVSKRQTAMLTARAVPYRPTPSRGYDWAMTLSAAPLPSWCWPCWAWRCSPPSPASGPTTSSPACATTPWAWSTRKSASVSSTA
jgi:ABC-type Fe3+ transport system permease subunit